MIRMSITVDELSQIMGDGQVVTSHGEKVGGIGQVYLDDATGTPNWVTVKSGFFGTKESFVPIDAARLDGTNLVVDYDEATIKDAPRIEADGALTEDEEQALYAHYGLAGTQDFAGDRTDEDHSAGHDTSGPNTDSAMTRSEERLRVGKEKVETGRVRLRKYVVTENVTQTVPVSREEVRLVREPITDENRGDAMAGPAISEEEHEIVLHAERPVVEKETIAVERIRVDADTVTEQETVTADVRKEQIELDDPTTASRNRG